MNIYKVYASEHRGYDTWGGAVVIAEDEQTAVRMFPGPERGGGHEQYDFCLLDNATWDRCELIAPAPEGSMRRVILASYHAG